jgi:hypothetical protein
MGCKHCMQDASPKGKHMTDETFDQVTDFCMEAGPVVVNVTGGEPTEHPNWVDYVKTLYMLPSVKMVMILTNGAWIDDDGQRLAMAKLIRMGKGRIGVQVYSNPKYYPDHEWTVEHAARFRSIGIKPDFESPIFMQDLGRARKNCQEEVRESDHVPSCINSHLAAMQTRSFHDFFMACLQAAKFCRPLIDPDGNIHMSESWLCPAVAHVSDGATEAFRKMRASRPCGGCQLYKNFERRFPKEMEILKK